MSYQQNKYAFCNKRTLSVKTQSGAVETAMQVLVASNNGHRRYQTYRRNRHADRQCLDQHTSSNCFVA